MPRRKNPELFTATFRNLKLKAWGFDQVLRETFAVTVFQVTCKPERWAARPQLSHGGHKWEAPTAAAVMTMVTADFEEQVSEWQRMPDPIEPSASLRSATDISTGRRRA